MKSKEKVLSLKDILKVYDDKMKEAERLYFMEAEGLPTYSLKQREAEARRDRNYYVAGAELARKIRQIIS